jgi:hypothetical protein
MNPCPQALAPVLINLTPHPVTIFTADRKIQIPPSGDIARCFGDTARARRTVTVDGHEIALVTDATTTTVTGLPPAEPDVLLIVSRLVALAAPDRPDLVFPHTPVRDDTGRIQGCRALAHLAPDSSVAAAG